jgi:polysaccharide pyruvyl transferase CsaB
MPEPRVFISGYYGYANTGDEAILSVLVSELRARLPGVSIAVLSGRPEQTEATHGVRGVLWSDPQAIAREVAQADLVITGGGGLFHDYGGYSEDGLLSEGNWGIGFHVTAGMLAALYEKPHVICGAGVGPLFSEQGRVYLRAICEAAQAVCVRDEGSRQLLEQSGVSGEKVEVTADLAFLLARASDGRVAEILDAEAIPASGLRLGVVVRHWQNYAERGVWETELAAALDAFAERRAGAQILFLPFQQFPGEQEDDRAAAVRVRSLMRCAERSRIVQGCYPAGEMAALLATCQCVVAMRLHAVIFSLAAGVPFVALAYDEKVRQAVRRAGSMRHAIELNQLRREALLEMLEQALGARAAANIPRELARRNVDIAVAVLKRGAKVAPLSGAPLALVREAIEGLMKSNAKWRAWLADQKVNYEYQIRQQGIEWQQERLRLQQELAESGQAQAQTQLQLAAAQSALGLLQQRHLQLAAESEAREKAWEAYGDEVQLRLANYRSQRAWRVMLALRKAYVILTRRGWAGRVQFLPWLGCLFTGRGAVETEQLEFPVPPRRKQLR